MLFIISILVVILAGLLAAKLSGSFVLNKDEKRAIGSYLLISVNIDLNRMRGRLKIWKWSLSEFGLMRKKKKKVRKDPIKKKKRFRLTDIELEQIKLAKKIVGYFRIDELMVKIRGGFSEPFYTGKIYGYYWAIRGMFPKLMSHFDFKPDFSSEKLSFDSNGKMSIRLVYIVWIAIMLGYVFLSKRVKRNISIKERRTGYVH